MRRLLPPMLALLAPVVAGAAPVATFRNGGAAAWPTPAPGPSARVAWTAKAPSWSNASPVVVGDLVCATAEPATLWCVDAATGRPRWSTEVSFADTLPAAERPGWIARRDAARAAAAEVSTLQARYSALRRELRRSPDRADLDEALAATAAQLADARRRADSGGLHDTRGEREIIGWSSHAPTSDGQRVYVLFGNGVVAAIGLDGRRAWTVFVDDPPQPMRGYALGTAAAPLLVDGLLVVPHGRLRGLDPATGAVRWVGPAYADYAAPAVARVGGVTVLLTPAGEAVRVSDGAVVGSGLDSPWFTGWHVDGDRAFIVGGRAADVVSPDYVPVASAWRLSWDGARIRSSRLWSTPLDRGVRFYTPPVVLGGAVYATDDRGALWRLDGSTGAGGRVAEPRAGAGYTCPQAAAGSVLWGGEDGQLVSWSPGAAATKFPVTALRSTPVASGAAWYVRTLDSLVRVEVR